MSKFLQLNLSCFVTVCETSYWVKFYLPASPPPPLSISIHAAALDGAVVDALPAAIGWYRLAPDLEKAQICIRHHVGGGGVQLESPVEMAQFCTLPS